MYLERLKAIWGLIVFLSIVITIFSTLLPLLRPELFFTFWAITVFWSVTNIKELARDGLEGVLGIVAIIILVLACVALVSYDLVQGVGILHSVGHNIFRMP